MRVVRLILLGLLAFVVTIVWLFPAAPLIEKIKPNIKPVELAGVSGKLFNGQVASVEYADDLLPLEFQDVTWKFAAGALLKGGAGANFTFKGYGGGGDGQVSQQWNGDIRVSDIVFSAESKELEVLLPGPVAEFTGEITGQFDKVVLANQLLQSVSGQLNWGEAIIVTRLYGPEITANLGQLDIDIAPEQNAAHTVTITSAGGDLAVDGKVVVASNGDYQTNMLLTPSAKAPQELVRVLQQLTQPAGGGLFKIEHNGNMNQGT